MRWTLTLLILALLAGCASTAEPPIIALRNTSGRTLESMSVEELSTDQFSSAHIGYVSPMRNGKTTVIERAENPPPLPKEVIISWPRPDGYSERIVVDLSEVLRDATGEPGEMLVFEVRGQAHAVVYVE